MENQSLLAPKPDSEPSKGSLFCLVSGLLTVLCVALLATLLCYHFSMQSKSNLYSVHIFTLTKDLRAATADFSGTLAGRLTFEPQGEFLSITGTISQLQPGVQHGIHILSLVPDDGIDSSSLHFSTANTAHGCPGATPSSHAGDLGNISGDETGQAQIKIVTKAFGLVEVLGRVIAITEEKDTCGSQFEGKIISKAVVAAAQKQRTGLLPSGNE